MQPGSGNRRFTSWMILLLIPVSVAVFFTTTMQQYGTQLRFCTKDRTAVATLNETSYWGGNSQLNIRSFDLTTGEAIVLADKLPQDIRDANEAVLNVVRSIDGTSPTKWDVVKKQAPAIPLPQRNALLIATEDGGFFVREASGKLTLICRSLTWWWWPARWTAWTLGLIWWLTWSLKQRKERRSLQPFIDIAILHAVIFISTGARLWAYASGPHWNGNLNVWESVAFIGTGLSIVSWFLFWVVFGSQKTSLRFGAMVFGVAVVVATILLMWGAAAQSRRGSYGLAIAQTLIGCFTEVATIIALLAVVKFAGLRLNHKVDLTQPPVESRRQLSIRDLFIWMVAFGVLFTVLRQTTIDIPTASNLFYIFTSGLLAGSCGFLVLWLGISRSLWVVVLVAIGFAATYWYHYSIGRLEILHVGFAWLPLILVSAAAFRWHGYSLSRPEQRFDELDYDPAGNAAGEFVW